MFGEVSNAISFLMIWNRYDYVYLDNRGVLVSKHWWGHRVLVSQVGPPGQQHPPPLWICEKRGLRPAPHLVNQDPVRAGAEPGNLGEALPVVLMRTRV